MASTSYVIFRQEARVTLRDAGVQTSRGVSSLEKTIAKKGKKNKRRRAMKRKAKAEEPAAGASEPAVVATPAVTEPAPSAPTPPVKRLKPSIDARSRINLRHSGDNAYSIERAVVKRAQEQGISLTRQQ